MKINKKHKSPKKKEDKIEKAKLKYQKGGQVQGCGCPYGMEMGPNTVL
jgi:hypothetical protein|tara:strand:+ start:5107 stop:5250 length:144 start_codon:yes stop_codon:yes gene_type:complete